MHTLQLPTLCALLLTSLALGACEGNDPPADDAWTWELPAHFPKPIIPADNPMTREKVELGRMLFYDPSLSRDGSVSCASCHHQDKAFSDGVSLPTGIDGELITRNSMALMNLAWNTSYTWGNPYIKTLEEHALIPLFTTHPTEMGNAESFDLEGRVRGARDYVARFGEVFPSDADPITTANIVRAIGAFQRTLVSSDAAYDRYLQGDRDALTPAAKRGMELFFSEKFECFHCHGGVNFTSAMNHEGQIEATNAFHNTGLYNLDERGAYPASDQGLFDVTSKEGDFGKFRAPSLRNIAVTAPYMHDGSVATLEDGIEIYARGGRFIEEGPHAGDGAENPNKSSFVLGFRLRDTELDDLVAFLHSLTDESFLTNPDFSSPFED